MSRSFSYTWKYMHIYVCGWLQVNVKVVYNWTTPKAGVHFYLLYVICLFISLLSFRMAYMYMYILTFWHFRHSGDEIYWSVHNITLTFFTFFFHYLHEFLLCYRMQQETNGDKNEYIFWLKNDMMVHEIYSWGFFWIIW